MAQLASSRDERVDCVYRIDAKDRLLAFSGGWGGSAPEVQDSLWDHVTDDTTRQLYAGLLGQVRNGSPVEFCLRCDSPDRRRLLRMKIRALDDGAVQFSTYVIWSEQRPPVGLLDRASRRSGPPLRICGWCQKLERRGRWQEIEAVVEADGLFEHDILPPLVSSVCPDCEATLRDLLEQRARAGQGPLVALVMADSFVREWVCGKLQKAGFAVRISADARSALDALAREPDGIDVVLVDLDVPDSEGLQLAEAVKQSGAAVPVVMLTGSITPATRRAAEAAGVAKLVLKDNMTERLVAALFAVLPGCALR